MQKALFGEPPYGDSPCLLVFEGLLNSINDLVFTFIENVSIGVGACSSVFVAEYPSNLNCTCARLKSC